MIDVDKLAAGPELDALVAEKVMGWKPDPPGNFWVDQNGIVHANRKYGPWMDTGEVIFEPSTDIAAAWFVLERLNDILAMLPPGPNESTYWVQLVPYGSGSARVEIVRDGNDLPAHYLDALFGTGNWDPMAAPLAICRAALAACGVK